MFQLKLKKPLLYENKEYQINGYNSADALKLTSKKYIRLGGSFN